MTSPSTATVHATARVDKGSQGVTFGAPIDQMALVLRFRSP